MACLMRSWSSRWLSIESSRFSAVSTGIAGRRGHSRNIRPPGLHVGGQLLHQLGERRSAGRRALPLLVGLLRGRAHRPQRLEAGHQDLAARGVIPDLLLAGRRRSAAASRSLIWLRMSCSQRVPWSMILSIARNSTSSSSSARSAGLSCWLFCNGLGLRNQPLGHVRDLLELPGEFRARCAPLACGARPPAPGLEQAEIQPRQGLAQALQFQDQGRNIPPLRLGLQILAQFRQPPHVLVPGIGRHLVKPCRGRDRVPWA